MVYATTYFEASHNGSQENTPTVYTVAGWVGFADKWADFASKWLSILPPELDGFFHMTDFLSRQNEYADWPKAKRKRVYHGLAKLIGETVEHGFASSVHKHDYDAVVRSKIPRVKGPGMGPQYFGFNLIRDLEDIEEWARDAEHNEPIVYVFAGGDRAGNDIRNLFRKLIRSPEHSERFRLNGAYPFVPDVDARKEPRLQAADVLAVLANRRIASVAKYGTVNEPERHLRILGRYLGRDRKLKNVLYNNRESLEMWLNRADKDVRLLFDPFEKGSFAGFESDD
jgi:hypothetical protein